jgi:hypothetical protein
MEDNKLHPFTNMETFKEWSSDLACCGCKLFIDGKCTHENASEHEVEKKWIADDAINRGDDFSVDWGKKIDEHFICMDYINKAKLFSLK